MTAERGPWWSTARTAALLALLAYLPALTAAPGRMPSDSKLYLYLDPGSFFGDAASTFDPGQFAGWVPHQHIAYLWPSGPWFWVFDTVGVPDWIAHRLWIGTIMVLAGLGVRWCARVLGLGATAALTAAVVYQLALYVLPYVSRTSVMLLPWAGLGWIVAFTIRAGRRHTWGDPAAIALIVLTVGAVNATALAMIVPAPALWLIHAVWQRTLDFRDGLLVAARLAVMSLAVSLWWIAMLIVQGRYGIDVLPYSESLADVSLTATSAETWRGLGYWLFYVRDPYAATTTESLRYLSSTVSIAISYLIPIGALVALTWVRWAHRRFVALLIAAGLVLAVGVHPIDGRSPLMRVLAGSDDGGLALALRSSTRALPVAMLGIALALAMAVDASEAITLPRLRLSAASLSGVVVMALAIANLPALWNGGFVDEALERDQDPPDAWLDAAAALDESGDRGRVLQVPGAEFGAYRWGYTVDQPLPGLTDKPVVTRDLLPLGSAGAMDLLYALDDRMQDGVLEPTSVAPIARRLGADTIWLTNDIAFDRFRTARPEVVRDLVVAADGLDAPVEFGELMINRPTVPMTDERAVGDRRVGAPVVPVELVPVEDPGRVVRAGDDTVVVSGSGDGLVDAAAAGLLDGDTAIIRYSADLDDRSSVLDEAVGLLVTDSNRDQARHWRSSQDTRGYTEPGGPAQGVLRPVASDARLELFSSTDAMTQTVAEQRGPAVATATAYGEPFAYLPEHRPYMAIDGDPTTSWIVGEHGDPIGEMIRLEFDQPVRRLVLRQPDRPGDRRITSIKLESTKSTESAVVALTELDESSWGADGQEVVLGAAVTSIDIEIVAVAGGTPFTGSAVAGVGFVEIEHGLGPTVEVVRPPHDALAVVDEDTPLAIEFTRLRTDPMDRWRDDPETTLVREFDLPSARDFDITLTTRIDARADDAALAELFDWPAVASSRLAGSPQHAGVAALDGDQDTTWITGFGEAEGASLRTTSTTEITEIAVRQPVAGFSRVTELTIRSGGETRTVTLTPDAAGGATGTVSPALPAGDVEFILSGIEPELTNDRRFGDPVTLPAAIAELTYEGRPTASVVGTENVVLTCVPVATIDSETIKASIDVADWLDGAPLLMAPCDATVSLGAGSHLVASATGGLPVTLDRVVLDDRLRAGLSNAASDDGPQVAVIESDRRSRSVEVRDCQAGCWLVLGEGYSEAWSADGPFGSLGAPVLVDGGFNGWWIEPVDDPIVIDVEWTAQRPVSIALWLSGFAALLAVGLIALDRRRRGPRVRPSGIAPVWSAPERLPATRRDSLLLILTWAGVAGLLISPHWALWGAVSAVGALALRRCRAAELTALASLIAVAGLVVVRERRSAPPPNGGWPSAFESVHGLGMFAVACLVVGALLSCNDADAPDHSDDPETSTEPDAADDTVVSPEQPAELVPASDVSEDDDA